MFIVREALDKSLSKIIRENDFYRISPLSIDDLVVNYSSVVSHIWFTGAFYVCHKTTKHIILLNIIFCLPVMFVELLWIGRKKN